MPNQALQPTPQSGADELYMSNESLMMANEMKHIHSYYSPNDLYNKIIEGLNKLGKDLSKITLDDLLAC